MPLHAADPTRAPAQHVPAKLHRLQAELRNLFSTVRTSGPENLDRPEGQWTDERAAITVRGNGK